MSAIKKRPGFVVVLQGDDYARLRELDQALDTQARAVPLRKGDASPVHAAAEERDTFAEEAAARALVFELQALGKTAWRTFRSEHPPEKGAEEHTQFGFNTDSGGNAAVVASLLQVTQNGEPLSLPSPAATEELLDDLSDGDFSRILTEIVNLNEGDGPDPKLSTSTLVTRAYGGTEESPSRLG